MKNPGSVWSLKPSCDFLVIFLHKNSVVAQFWLTSSSSARLAEWEMSPLVSVGIDKDHTDMLCLHVRLFKKY